MSALAGAATVGAAPAGWRTFECTAADKVSPDLKPHFVAFSFSYPETFKLSEPKEGIFAAVKKFGPNGKDEMATFTVSWYEADDAKSNKGIAETLASFGEQWAARMSNFSAKKTSTTMLKLDGVLADGATWEFRTPDSEAAFVAAAKSYFVHQPGTTHGLRIDLYGTYYDPKLKSAKNLGDGDDLGRILGTFKFLGNKNESPAPPVAKTKPSDAEEFTADDQQALATAAQEWLALLDDGNYRKTLATASESFGKNLTPEKWKQNHALMQKQSGPVTERSTNASITVTRRESDDGTKNVTRTLKIKTTFAKMTGIENVTMTKEDGVWKVTDYSITTGSD